MALNDQISAVEEEVDLAVIGGGPTGLLSALLASRLGLSVYYKEKVISISETKDGVTLSTDRGRKVRSKYAIAADGARSTVRRALNISFTGTKPEMVWAVLDTFIDTDFPLCSEIITFQLRGQSRVSWIPRERGMARFYVLLDGEITQERAEESIREHMAPHRVDFVKTEWFSTFDVKERIASTFVSNQGAGRIILAGDAAHVHSVNGGQGLNTGVADAFSLSWRVAAAANNEGLSRDTATKLIRSYDTERRAVAQEVIDVAAALVRDTAHTAKQYVSTIEKNAGYITGMGVSYAGVGSELIVESERGIWKAGKRCPDLRLTRAGSEETTRLYSTISYGKYLVFFVGQSEIQLSFKSVCSYFVLLPKISVDGDKSGYSNGFGGQVKVFLSDDVATEDSFVVVVRPDMYIGYVGEGNGWREYLEQV